MAQRIAVECTCARCPRTWYATYDPKKQEAETTSIKISIRGPGGLVRDVSYDALCDTCSSAVAALVGKIDRKFERASMQRKSKAKEEEQETAPAVVLPVPPVGTPKCADTPGSYASASAAASAPSPSKGSAPPSTKTASGA